MELAIAVGIGAAVAAIIVTFISYLSNKLSASYFSKPHGRHRVITVDPNRTHDMFGASITEKDTESDEAVDKD